MRACDSFNAFQIWYGRQNSQGTGAENLCYSLSWNAALNDAVSGLGANCWLLNDTIANAKDVNTTAPGWISANLLSIGERGYCC